MKKENSKINFLKKENLEKENLETNKENILIKDNITYKFIKFEVTYFCNFWSSNIGSDVNDIFGKEFSQEEYDNLFGIKKPEVKKKLTKKEKLELQRKLDVEKSRKLMGLN